MAHESFDLECFLKSRLDYIVDWIQLKILAKPVNSNKGVKIKVIVQCGHFAISTV